jgi:hypothetical protein
VLTGNFALDTKRSGSMKLNFIELGEFILGAKKNEPD